MIFWLAGSIGQLFSGFLQAAAYTNLDGVGGYSGWRWLFIIDGIITLPLAVAGFIFFPNLPQSGNKTWWTTEEEHILSVKRMRAIGRAGKEPWTRAKFNRILLSWHTYLLRTYPHSSCLTKRLETYANQQEQPCCTSSGTMDMRSLAWVTGWKVLTKNLLRSQASLLQWHRSMTVNPTYHGSLTSANIIWLL